MRRFYAPPDNFSPPHVKLDPEETRHLRDVLRLRPGAPVRIFDGAGREFLCEIETIGKKESGLKIIEETVPTAPESSLDLTLAVALLKGEKFEWVIQKAVELGVSGIIPLLTKRTEVKLQDPKKKLERWRKIVPEASKQCGRAKLMNIGAPVEFAGWVEAASVGPAGLTDWVLFSERNGTGFSGLENTNRLMALIGPEGGWDETEIKLAQAKKMRIVTLGGRILRAETAVITVSALLQNRFGDLR
jgi:16S rRNA (uracil1498-N3)-methyltransferase